MPNENQEQENQEFEAENVELENEQEAESETELEAEAENAETKEAEQEQENLEESKQDESAPKWVKEVRKKNRELLREIKELKAKQQPQTNTNDLVLEKKPTLADFEYDEEAFENASNKWHEKKIKIDNLKQEQEQAQTKQKEYWNNRLIAYNNEAQTLKVNNFSEREEVVKQIFDLKQQGIILETADNPASLIYALGGDEDLAEEIANETNPVKFIARIAKLEEKLKMNKTKTAPPAPEKKITGNVPVTNQAKTLEKLRIEADKTGNYTKLLAYKKQMKGK